MRKDAAIILIGVKHSGKSTLGKALAEKRGVPFIDIDEVILKSTGRTPRDIYSNDGVLAFMNAESNACKVVKDKYQEQEVVIATGGGICDNPEALLILAPLGRFVLINAPLRLVMDRVFMKVHQKPDGTWEGLPAYVAIRKPATEVEAQEIFKRFMTERIDNYSHFADVIFDPVKDTIENNVKRIENLL